MKKRIKKMIPCPRCGGQMLWDNLDHEYDCLLCALRVNPAELEVMLERP